MNLMNFRLMIVMIFVNLAYCYACVNEYRTLLSGEVANTSPVSGIIQPKTIDTFELKQTADFLLDEYSNTKNIKMYSDYAATLIYLGDYTKAKNIYIEIEKESPDLYSTASNLGTIYELTGKVDSAYYWIRKSIELNPNSHFGSEWIHIKILEHKLKHDSSFQGSILDLDFDRYDIPQNPKGYNLKQLAFHIEHQLKERITFVKPKNSIVGNIYFDLGNIFAQIYNVEAGLGCYYQAKKYGFDSDLLETRIKTLEKLSQNSKPYLKYRELLKYISKNVILLNTVIIASILLFFFLLIKVIKRLFSNYS